MRTLQWVPARCIPCAPAAGSRAREQGPGRTQSGEAMAAAAAGQGGSRQHKRTCTSLTLSARVSGVSWGLLVSLTSCQAVPPGWCPREPRALSIDPASLCSCPPFAFLRMTL